MCAHKRRTTGDTLTSSAALKGRDSSRDLRSRCWFAVHRRARVRKKAPCAATACPAAVIRASIDAASGHTIHTDFPEIHVTTEGGEWGPKTVWAEGRLNGGGPVLKVKTSTGNIEFRRLTH